MSRQQNYFRFSVFGFRFLFISLAVLPFFFSSCSHSKDPDVSHVVVNLKFNRFEKDLFSLTGTGYKAQIDSLQKKYPELFPFYFSEIGGWNVTGDSNDVWKDSVWQYVQSSYSRALYDSVMKQFADLSVFEKKMKEALQHYKYYFPEAVIPEVNTLINAPPAFTVGDDLLCISLDKYMGSASAFYKYETEPVPEYILRRFKPEYMLSNCMEVLATGNFEFNQPGKKLLDAMIYKGKIIYFKQQVLPAVPDSIVTGFEEKDLQWCNDNEPEIWKFFIEHKLLYSVDPLEYSKYVNEGPNTSGMPAEAPGNIGSWVGWRIVSKYMEKNPGVTLQQLMQDENSQAILTASRYKPTR